MRENKRTDTYPAVLCHLSSCSPHVLYKILDVFSRAPWSYEAPFSPNCALYLRIFTQDVISIAGFGLSRRRPVRVYMIELVTEKAKYATL